MWDDSNWCRKETGCELLSSKEELRNSKTILKLRSIECGTILGTGSKLDKYIIQNQIIQIFYIGFCIAEF